MESGNKKYLMRLNELLNERDALKLALTDERNTALLATIQLRRKHCLLRAKNHQLKEEAAQAFNTAKEALNEVIYTYKTWVVKVFEILAEADDVPRYEHRAMVAGEEP